MSDAVSKSRMQAMQAIRAERARYSRRNINLWLTDRLPSKENTNAKTNQIRPDVDQTDETSAAISG
jgi:hypothetical protein